MTDPRLMDLLLRWEDGELSASELEELSDLLSGDPEKRREFLLHAMMSSEINQSLASEGFPKPGLKGVPQRTRRRASGPSIPARRVTGRWVAAIAGTAAAVLAIVLAAVLATNSPSADAGLRPRADRRLPSLQPPSPGMADRPGAAPEALARSGTDHPGTESGSPRETRPQEPSADAAAAAPRPVAETKKAGDAGPPLRPEAPPAPSEPGPAQGTRRDPPNVPASPAPASTRAVLATLERMRGDVSILAGGTKTKASPQEAIRPAQGLEVVGPFSEAVVLYPDMSRLLIGPDSRVAEFSDRAPGGPAGRVRFDHGTFAIDLLGQAEAAPFRVETPQAEVHSTGAYFVVSVDAESTRIEVGAGRVRLARTLDGRALDLSAGQFALVGPTPELSARPLQRADKKKKGKRDLELETRVASAVRGGLAYLEEVQAAIPIDSPDPGSTHCVEVILWALGRGGVPETDPGFQRLFGQMLTAELRLTYKVSLQAMIVEDLDRVKYQNRIAQCAQFLVDNQCRNGQWSYGDPVPQADLVPAGGKGRKEAPAGPAPDPSRPPEGRDRKERPKVVQKVVIQKRRDGPARGDNSNSQFAALGLRACADAGVILPQEVLKRGQTWWRESQGASKKGEPAGWSYGEAPGPLARTAYGSMTAGAVGCLVVYHYLLGEPWMRDDAIQRGEDWITRHFTVTENPFPDDPSRKNDPGNHYYYLYALERLGVLTGTETFGAREWYPEGANFLLRAQKPDGSWASGPEGFSRIVDTSLAILFLRRATRPLGDGAPGERTK